ncbi:MAG: hypothetical protein ACW9W3_07665 [Candidatus Nitrosopumilus sp. bin_68KS]
MEKTINEISTKPKIIRKEIVDEEKSVCGVLKDNTMKIILKLESEMPQLFQEYSDLYTRYLHSIKDIFGNCSIAEKQYFDKMRIDQKSLNIYDSYLKSVSKIYESQIDMATNFVRSYIQFRLSTIDAWDKFMHTSVNMCAKSFSEHLKRNLGDIQK